MNNNELQLATPRHQQWAMSIFPFLKQEIVPDFTATLKLNDLITSEMLLKMTQDYLNRNKINDAA